MAAAVGVRSDYTSADLGGFARRCRDADQVRRVLALAVILDGGSKGPTQGIGLDIGAVCPAEGKGAGIVIGCGVRPRFEPTV